MSARPLRHIKEPYTVSTIGSSNRGLDSNHPRRSEMGRAKGIPVGIRHRPHERDRTGAAPSACKRRRSANSIPSATTISSSSRGDPGGTREDGLRANWSTQTKARGPFAITSPLPLRRVHWREARCAMVLSASVLCSNHLAAARFTPWFTPQRDTKKTGCTISDATR